MNRWFRNAPIEHQLENQESRQVHEDVPGIGYGLRAGRRQNHLEKNRKKTQGHQSVDKRKPLGNRSPRQTVGRQNQAEDKRQTQKIVPVIADPSGSDPASLTDSDQKEEQHQRPQETPAPG